MSEEKAPGSGAFLPASLMYFCSGKPMHFCSGVDTVTVAKDIRQAVLASVRLRYLLRRPKVPPPRRKRQHKEKRDGGCYNNEHGERSVFNRSIAGAFQFGGCLR